LGSVDPTLTVRVLVADGFVPTSAQPATVRGLGGPFTVDGLAVTVPAGGTAALAPGAGGWVLQVTGPDGTLLGQVSGVGDAWIRPADPATRLQVVFRPSYYDTYRGAIHLVTSGGAVRAINAVALDDYLLGVVPAEMPASWPAAALAAQAIAARSYAVAHLQSGALYDLTADTGSQVYLGALYEKAATSAAVQGTAGQVLMSGGQVANALFHSTAGGATENNENVFVSWDGRPLASPVGYLRGIRDRDETGRPYDADSPWATWQTATYSLDALSAIFANDPRTAVGRLVALDLSHRGVSGRLITVTLIGTAGTKTVSGAYFKYVFNVYSPASDPAIRSTLFDLSPIP
jgi:stage II sporulation protein D